MDSLLMDRGQGWLRLTSFAPAEDSLGKLTVSLEADLLGGRRPPGDLRLLARRGATITAHRPSASHLEQIAGARFHRRGRVFHWRVCFELTRGIGEDPRTSFQLLAAPHPVIELPKLGWEASGPRPIYERRTPRLGVLLTSTAALLAGLAPGFALADGGSSPKSTTTTASTATAQTGSTGTASTPAPTPTSAPQPLTTSTTTSPSPSPASTSQAPPPTTTQTSTTTSTTPTSTKPGQAGGGGGAHHPKKSSTHHHSGRPAGHRHHGTSRHRVTHHTGGASPAPRHTAHPAPKRQPDSAGPTGGTPVVSSGTSFSIPVLSDFLTAAQLRTYDVLVGGMVEPPVFLQRIYRAAAHKYGIPWQVLAAINYLETRYGKDLAVSPAGAIGWMQFMPSTWAEYGESVNLKGKPAGGTPNPWDPTDAIFAAARYLRAAGARPNLPGAVYAYNHAGWYVQEVLSIAEEINRHNLWPQRHASRKVAAMLTMARLLNGLPYVWGGGHANFVMVQPGYDCSGFVSAVLHAGGYLDGPVTTQTLPGQPLILPGRGRYVTIRDRTYLSADQDHVIIDIDGQWWESGGWGVESDRVHRMHDVTRAYLDSFNLILHPRGL